LSQHADCRIRPLDIAGQWRIDIARAEQLDAARIDVVCAGRQRFGELSLHTQVELKRVGGTQVWREPDDAGGLICEDASERKRVGIARIRKIHLAQSPPVKAQSVADGKDAGAVVKDPRAATQDHFALFARRVGKRKAWGKVILVPEKILLVVAQAGGE